MSEDLKQLDEGIFPLKPKPKPKCKKIKPNRPKKLKEEDYHTDYHNEHAPSDNAANAQLPAECLQQEHEQDQDQEQEQEQPYRIPLDDLQLPFMVPTSSLLVPLFNRRSWSMAPNFMKRHRYLRTLNELRLARAIQAAAAARNNAEPEHMDEFEENLRRLVSNREAIEQRVTSLLADIHNAVSVGH
ncbi:hypothetical protein KR215_001328 [Drosophila sulfurigaster]|nr:hypothetical protein KR215_001328 [Drosophila sulfurigaster]